MVSPFCPHPPACCGATTSPPLSSVERCTDTPSAIVMRLCCNACSLTSASLKHPGLHQNLDGARFGGRFCMGGGTVHIRHIVMAAQLMTVQLKCICLWLLLQVRTTTSARTAPSAFQQLPSAPAAASASTTMVWRLACAHQVEARFVGICAWSMNIVWPRTRTAFEPEHPADLHLRMLLSCTHHHLPCALDGLHLGPFVANTPDMCKTA